MTQEQKAKAYDEAIKTAKNNYEAIMQMDNDCTFAKEGIVNTFHRMFPELKGSGDERIRKDIVTYLTQSANSATLRVNAQKFREWIAWLEKQTTPQVRTGIEWVNTIDDACDARYAEEYSHGEYCHEQSFKWGFNEGVEWLEKQRNQKPFDYENATIIQKDFAPKSAIEALKEEKVDGATKVEPKFKVGDWIIGRATNNEPRQISEITDQCYKSTYGGQYGFSFENEMHLWTIADAKNGDVLANNGNIILFKQISDSARPDYKFIQSYCFVLTHSFYFYLSGVYNLDDGFHPATKDQYNTLMKAMADAGYTFDFEKKELKKNENKNPLLSDFFKAEYESGKLDALKCVEWSGEDEKKVNNLCVFLDQMVSFVMLGNKDATEFKDWLKSLKDRVQPQPKQEWGEEDEKMIDNIIDYIMPMPIFFTSTKGKSGKEYTKEFIKEAIDWLKSLRPQSTWKPSDEQMGALRNASIYIEGYNSNFKGSGSILEKLYNDLKKLRGE